MKYRVTLPDDCECDRRTLSGLGTFENGEPRELELTKRQVISLKARGFEVRKKVAPKPKNEAGDKIDGEE